MLREWVLPARHWQAGPKELRERIPTTELKAVDLDHNGTVDEQEDVELVDMQFKAADKNSDGKLSSEELYVSAGRTPMPLLR